MDQRVARTCQIERCERLSPQDFTERYVRLGVPVIVSARRGTDRPSRIWSLDDLLERDGAHTVTVEHLPSGDIRGRLVTVKMSLAEYVTLIRTQPEQRRFYYLAARPLADSFPKAAQEIGVPAVLAWQERLLPYAFAGIDTYSAAHYHQTPWEAVLRQLGGKKQLSLYAPSACGRMNPHPWYSTRCNWSQLEDPAADGTALPVDAIEHRCVLEPDDMLFIPQGWFHVTRGIGESISCTYMFEGRRRMSHPRIAFRDGASRALQKGLVLPLAAFGKRNPYYAKTLERFGQLLGILSSQR